MNYYDFLTSPVNSPLEAETLDFVQGNLKDAIEATGLLGGTGNFIISGCIITGNSMTDGWIMYNGELLFFQGGTVQTNFIIEETVTQKANQSGALVDRYFVRKAKFGSGAGQVAFSTLKRVNNCLTISQILNRLANGQVGGTVDDWVIISGLQPSGSNTITAGKAIVGDRILDVPQYVSGGTIDTNNPVYLTTNGEWTTSANAAWLKFEPYTENRYESMLLRGIHPLGSIIFMKTGTNDYLIYFTGGLGQWNWKGWARADGANGTVDLATFFSGQPIVPIQRIS